MTKKRYSVFTGSYLPSGRWQDRKDKLMNYKQAAAYVTTIIEKEKGETTSIQVWDTNYQAVWRTLTNEVHVNTELQNREHNYIAKAIENAIRRKSKKRNNKKAYEAMVEESERLGLPEVFKTDLTTRDLDKTSSIPEGQPFGWVLRVGGTQFLELRPDSYHFYLKMVDRTFAHPIHYYLWDGEKLQEMTWQELAETLYEKSSLGLSEDENVV